MNRDLDRRVAEKLGWTKIETYIHKVRGKEILEIYGNLIGVKPGGTEETWVPKWSTSLDCAIELWQENFCLVRITSTGLWVVDTGEIYEVPTPAEAICLAFLGEEK